MSVQRNVDVVFALVKQAAADQSFGEELAAAGVDEPMVLLPADDPELARENESVALRLAARGEPFQVRRVSRALASRR